MVAAVLAPLNELTEENYRSTVQLQEIQNDHAMQYSYHLKY